MSLQEHAETFLHKRGDGGLVGMGGNEGHKRTQIGCRPWPTIDALNGFCLAHGKPLALQGRRQRGRQFAAQDSPQKLTPEVGTAPFVAKDKTERRRVVRKMPAIPKTAVRARTKDAGRTGGNAKQGARGQFEVATYI